MSMRLFPSLLRNFCRHKEKKRTICANCFNASSNIVCTFAVRLLDKNHFTERIEIMGAAMNVHAEQARKPTNWTEKDHNNSDRDREKKRTAEKKEKKRKKKTFQP